KPMLLDSGALSHILGHRELIKDLSPYTGLRIQGLTGIVIKPTAYGTATIITKTKDHTLQLFNSIL
ncbi:hypothetical protein G3M48_010588, partial [Beauveria asiatica]